MMPFVAPTFGFFFELMFVVSCCVVMLAVVHVGAVVGLRLMKSLFYSLVDDEAAPPAVLYPFDPVVYCSDCGSGDASGARFCILCGAVLAREGDTVKL